MRWKPTWGAAPSSAASLHTLPKGPSGCQSVSRATMGTHQAGDIVLGRFRLDRPLASGAMGDVWAGTETASGRAVAVKLATGDGVLRADREAEVLAGLDHPGVVGFVAGGEDGDAHVLVMELLDGVPLSTHIGGAPPDVGEALDLAAQLADALVHVHERGVVHRDVKASNAIVVRRGGRLHAVLIDFGLGLTQGSARVSVDNLVIGSTHTMPPEQVQGGKARAPGDVYSLGAVAFRMVCGRYPYHASSAVQVLAMHAHAAVPTLAQRARRPVKVPRGLEGLLQQMLAKDPGQRPTASEVSDRLGALAAVPRDRWVQVEPENAEPMSEPPLPPPPTRDRRPMVLAAAASVLFALAAAWWFVA